MGTAFILPTNIEYRDIQLSLLTVERTSSVLLLFITFSLIIRPFNLTYNYEAHLPGPISL